MYVLDLYNPILEPKNRTYVLDLLFYIVYLIGTSKIKCIKRVWKHVSGYIKYWFE